MNLEPSKNSNKSQAFIEEIDFDFKPITSGLGFHHQKATEVKPTITERTVAVAPMPTYQAPKKEMNVYQSDLSIFYGQAQAEPVLTPEIGLKEEKYFKLATRSQRVFSYLTDLLLIASLLGIVMTVMARTISMDLMEVWAQYPNEITPLVITLFCGFYLLYFSVFEKANQSTLGKNLFGLRVVGYNDKPLSLVSLLARSSISLLNFVSLGLFSYFDLQNKVTNSKVIRND